MFEYLTSPTSKIEGMWHSCQTALVWFDRSGISEIRKRGHTHTLAADSPLCSTNTLKAWEREAEELSLTGLRELVLGFTGLEPGADKLRECREPALVFVLSRSLPCWAPIALICTSPAERSRKTEKR